jgi:glutamyl-tRNA reductase
MLERLILNNFSSGTRPSVIGQDNYFCLQTCQRSLYLSLDINPICPSNRVEYHQRINGKDAYLYLLETICGLKSKLIGENEIVGQFKKAFKDFLDKEHKDKQLIRILEKLFKDAKNIRSNYLLGLSQKTYSSITRKHISNKYRAESVLILGSGSLAEDLVNQFKKKCEVFICARNQVRLAELASIHADITILPWFDRDNISDFSFIANTVGTSCTLFKEDFFQRWSIKHPKRLFVDLGSPSCIQTSSTKLEHVMRLEDIFEDGAIHEDHKIHQIKKARNAMNIIIDKRQQHLSNHINSKIQSQLGDTQIDN